MNQQEFQEWAKTCDEWLKQSIGQPVEEIREAVESAGNKFFVAVEDGQSFVGFANLDPTRIKVRVENGLVTKAWRG